MLKRVFLGVLLGGASLMARDAEVCQRKYTKDQTYLSCKSCCKPPFNVYTEQQFETCLHICDPSDVSEEEATFIDDRRSLLLKSQRKLEDASDDPKPSDPAPAQRDTPLVVEKKSDNSEERSKRVADILEKRRLRKAQSTEGDATAGQVETQDQVQSQPPPPPPPPPMRHQTDKTTVPTKQTMEKPADVAESGTSDRSKLLEQIRQGKKLKKVKTTEDTPATLGKGRDSDSGDMLSALKKKLNTRRQSVKGKTTENAPSEDDDWED